MWKKKRNKKESRLLQLLQFYSVGGIKVTDDDVLFSTSFGPEFTGISSTAMAALTTVNKNTKGSKCIATDTFEMD